MNHDDYTAAIVRKSEAFAAAADGNLGAAVPSCPGWRVSDLVWHLSEAHDFWRTIVEDRLDDSKLVPPYVERPDDNELVPWFRAGVTRLHDVLAGTDPATPCWTWSSRNDVAFVARRMAHETIIHGWDAGLAAGEPPAIDTDLAVDGIDEFCEHWLGDPGAAREPMDGTVHLHTVDADGEWLVEPDGAALIVRREHGKGSAAVRGTASDLLLLLWRRKRPVDAGFEVFGDESVLARFLAHADLD
jgi:uncharacterized protein (TIGR03083 family)